MSSASMNLGEQVARVGRDPGQTSAPRALDAGLEAAIGAPSSSGENGGDGDRAGEQHSPAEPTTNGGRDQQGRFTAGNKGGPGNPFAREVARIRQRIQAKLSDEEIDAIMDALMAKARSGDVAAAKLLLSYGVGKPAAGVDPDQLDVQEWSHWKNTAKMMYDLPQMLKSMMPEILLEMVRTVRPVASAELTKQMGQAFMNPESVLPPEPELVMGRSDKPLKRGGKPAAANDGAGVRNPRGSEHVASGLDNGAGPSANGGLPQARRRAWGLPSTANGGRGGKKNGKMDGRPSAKGDNGRGHAERNGAPSRNGVVG